MFYSYFKNYSILGFFKTYLKLSVWVALIGYFLTRLIVTKFVIRIFKKTSTQIDDILIQKGLLNRLSYLIPIAIIIVTLCKGLATYTHSYQMSKVAHSIIAKLQTQMFEKLMYLNMKFYNDSKSGNLISRLINDTYYLRLAIVKSVTGIIKDVLVIIFLLGNMFYQSWTLTLFAFFAFPLAIWPIRKIGKSIRKITYTIQNEIAVFSNVLAESIKGIRQVKAYSRENYEKQRAFETISFIQKYFTKSAFISNRLSPLMEFIGSLAVALSIYAGGVFVLNESMTTGQFMSFLVSLLLAYQPVKALGNLNISVQEGLAGAERIFKLLDTSEKNMENISPKKTIDLDGDIVFKDVSFAYNDNTVLDKISLRIPKGKKVALVGLSGSGKSTIANIILRLYDNYSGSILINSKDIKELDLTDVRNSVSIVTQETILFNESIFNNIKYGNLKATDEEISLVAKNAGVSSFSEELDQKLDTVIGENGVKLSGGQRQRIAIARALIKDAPLLIMDEATSSLDNITENKIHETINSLMNNKTKLIIAHRLSTIEDADIIYVLDKGKIESQGKHEELISKSTIYKKLQLREQLENEF